MKNNEKNYDLIMKQYEDIENNNNNNNKNKIHQYNSRVFFFFFKKISIKVLRERNRVLT